MNRRDAIKKTGMMLGLAAGSPLLLHVLQGCSPEKVMDWKPLFFNKNQASLVSEIVNQILPRTDTPGAIDVGVDVFVDKMVAEVYSKSAQELFLKGLDNFEEEIKVKSGKLFSDLDSKGKYDYLHSIDSQLQGLSYATAPEEKPFFLMVKELTLLGYFTSEEIMTKHLDYIPIPMQLVGCEPIKENQKLRVGNYF
jgi:hypothetical protein